MAGGTALNTSTPSGLTRPLGLLAGLLGILAALLVLATLVLLAVDGHPEGLLCAVAGAAVPVLLWGGWRLAQLARIRLRSPGAALVPGTDKAAPPAAAEEVTAMAVVEVTLEDMPPLPRPTRSILVPVAWP